MDLNDCEPYWSMGNRAPGAKQTDLSDLETGQSVDIKTESGETYRLTIQPGHYVFNDKIVGVDVETTSESFGAIDQLPSEVFADKVIIVGERFIVADKTIYGIVDISEPSFLRKQLSHPTLRTGSAP